MELQIFLLRHGEPKFPDERSYIYGQTDYPLSERGFEQARRIGSVLADTTFDRLFTSDLSRAIQTAEVVAELSRVGLPRAEVVPGLREIDMGEWDGLPKTEIAAKFFDIFAARGDDLANVSAPGGETFVELQRRSVAAFDDVLARSAGAKRILIAAHGGVFWSIVCHLFGIDLGYMRKFGLDFCALHIIERNDRDGSFVLQRYNWAPLP